MTEKKSVSKMAELRAHDGQVDALKQALLQLEGLTQQEPGCRRFNFYQSLSVPSRFLLLEEFETDEALQIHMSAGYTQNFFALELVAEAVVRDF